jgi:hypothetical protein
MLVRSVEDLRLFFQEQLTAKFPKDDDKDLENLTNQAVHVYFTHQFRILGYIITQEGICAGLAAMGSQAALLDENEEKELTVFNNRLDQIASQVMPILALYESSQITAKQEFILFLTKAISQNSLCNYITRQPRDNKVDIATFVDIHAFFDGVALHLESKEYSKYLGLKKPISQVDTEILFSLTKPKKGTGNVLCDSFRGMYEWPKHLEVYKRLLQKIVIESPCNVSFFIESMGHRISLCYNSKKKYWYLIDAKQLPVKKIPGTLDILTKLLMNAFSSKFVLGKILLSTTMFTAKSSQVLFEIHLNKVKYKNTIEFKKIHLFQNINALSTIGGEYTLLHMAARYGDIHLIKKLLIAGADAEITDYKARCPFDIANIFHQENAAFLLSKDILTPKKMYQLLMIETNYFEPYSNEWKNILNDLRNNFAKEYKDKGEIVFFNSNKKIFKINISKKKSPIINETDPLLNVEYRLQYSTVIDYLEQCVKKEFFRRFFFILRDINILLHFIIFIMNIMQIPAHLKQNINLMKICLRLIWQRAL